MIDPQLAAETLELAFKRIHQEQMAGIPLLNPMLKVRTIGFQEFQGRIIGVLITPWLMNLVMLPGEADDWSEMDLGVKQYHRFPSNTYKFVANEIEGMGKCQTHSLYSPMNEFVNQDHALAAAQGFLDTLMVEVAQPAEGQVDEELLGRIMRGEEIPELDPGGLATPETMASVASPIRGTPEMKVRVEKKLSRRELLRGSFVSDA
ncbi:MAG: [NiFe]-hydrogenase assembly chaperone HybE [Gammaproteobacteria bacterium]|nr:[NiFe]-hydrogenase assembly chaperone HybE [Gammaproteobacteria bacterium]